MEDVMSRGNFPRTRVRALDGSAGEGGGCAGGRSPRAAAASSAWRRLSREDVLGGLPPALFGASAGAHVWRDAEALGDDGLGLFGTDRRAVGVADHVGRAPLHDRPGGARPGWPPRRRAHRCGSCPVRPSGRSRARVSWGSHFRAWSAARTRVVRNSDEPALDMAWPLRSLSPVSEALGTRPLKERNALPRAKRLGSPMAATRAGPPTWARPGSERARASGSTRR